MCNAAKHCERITNCNDYYVLILTPLMYVRFQYYCFGESEKSLVCTFNVRSLVEEMKRCFQHLGAVPPDPLPMCVKVQPYTSIHLSTILTTVIE